ncbi:MAG: glycosyltransferase family 2 protein [Anaerolineae bacterium]|nr:glycosyltransferase family 2 protein [Anaerolineae bacterium]
MPSPEDTSGNSQPGQAKRTSIIIINYNSGAYLTPCLASVLQTVGPQDEVILVDNASSDGSTETVAAAFPDVRIVRNRENLGFAGAGNVGAEAAQGRILVFLNPDTHVTPGWLDALITPLDQNQQVGVVTAKVLLLQSPDRINTCGNEIHVTGLTLCRGMGAPATRFTTPAVVDAVSGAAFAISKQVFQALGGFDPTFFLYMEDTDFSLRARLAGYQCLYTPDSVIYHDYELRFGPRKTFFQERNRYLMLLKTLRWGTLFLLWPILLLGEILTWGFAILRDRPNLFNKLQAYGWIVKHWPAIRRQHRKVQTLRRVRDRDLLRHAATRLAFEQTGAGWIARASHWVFDPLFFILHRLVLLVLWW